MDFTVVIIFSFSIVIPVILGLIRFKKIDVVYRPLLYCLCIGLVNESVGFVLSRYHKPNVINVNIYYIIESILLLTLFRNWNILGNRNQRYIPLVLLLITGWLYETVFISKMKDFDSWFLIGYSTILCILSLFMLANLITYERGLLLTNADFIICITFLMYYSFTILSEIFWMYGSTLSRQFLKNIAAISNFTNLFSNLFYTIAIAWMPTKRRFSMPSS